MYAAGRYVNNALNGVWHAVIGRRLIAANINSKVPVADLEAFLKAEKEVMQDVRQRVASVGIDPKGALPRNLSPQQQIALVKAWEEARSAHPTHGLLAKQLEHAKWHAMHKAPADYVNFFTRETVYASGAGLIGGFAFSPFALPLFIYLAV
jgi:hypothetical protein